MGGAAIFDLDKTLIASSVTLAFSGDLMAAGILPRRTVARGALMGAVYHRFGASADAILRAKDGVAALMTGLDVDRFVAVIEENLDRVILPLVYEEGRALIAGHRAAGRPIVIASSSGEEAVTRVAQILGADHVIATVAEVEDGRYTGNVPFFAFADAKAEAVRRLAAKEHWDLSTSYAYSDSITDLPLLEAVGHPHVVNPDKELRLVAEERAWPVLTFRRARRRSVARALPEEAGRAARHAARGTAGGMSAAATRTARGLKAPANRLFRPNRSS